MGQIKNIKLHIVTDIKQTTCPRNVLEVGSEGNSGCPWLSLSVPSSTVPTTAEPKTSTSSPSVASKVVSTVCHQQQPATCSSHPLRKENQSSGRRLCQLW